jgi:hypothetical protein
MAMSDHKEHLMSNDDNTPKSTKQGFEDNAQPLNGPRPANPSSVEDADRTNRVHQAYDRALEMTAKKIVDEHKIDKATTVKTLLRSSLTL